MSYANPSNLPCWSITGAAWVSIGCTCDTAGGSVTIRLVGTDVYGSVSAVSPRINFVADTGPPDFGGAWLGTGGEWPVYSVCCDQLYVVADKAGMVGVWTFSLQAFNPSP